MQIRIIIFGIVHALILGIFLVSFSLGQQAEENDQIAEKAPLLATSFDSQKAGHESGKNADDTPASAETDIKPKVPAATKTEPVAKPEANGPRQNSQYRRPPAKIRLELYVDSVVGPFALAGSAASAGFSTLANSPEEWGKGGKGFAKRLASDFGQNAIRNTAIYGLDEALKLDSNFYPSRKKKFGKRIKHALFSPLTAYNKKGKRVVGVPRIAGSFGAAVIARKTWYPKRYSYKDGLKSGTISLGVRAAINLVKEFSLF